MIQRLQTQAGRLVPETRGECFNLRKFSRLQAQLVSGSVAGIQDPSLFLRLAFRHQILERFHRRIRSLRWQWRCHVE